MPQTYKGKKKKKGSQEAPKRHGVYQRRSTAIFRKLPKWVRPAASLSPLPQAARPPLPGNGATSWNGGAGMASAREKNWRKLRKILLQETTFLASSLKISTWAMPLTEPGDADRDTPALCSSHQELTWTVTEHFESFQVELLMVLLLIPCITRRAPELAVSSFHPFLLL